MLNIFHELPKSDTCPICGGKIVMTEKSINGRSWCENGHCWRWVAVTAPYQKLYSGDKRIHRETVGWTWEEA